MDEGWKEEQSAWLARCGSMTSAVLLDHVSGTLGWLPPVESRLRGSCTTDEMVELGGGVALEVRPQRKLG